MIIKCRVICYLKAGNPGEPLAVLVPEHRLQNGKKLLSVPNKLVLGDSSFEILIDTGRKRFIRLWTH